MPRRPRTSTPFPYTTLFRSLVPEGQQEADFFTVTGGELVLASADSGRVEGSFRIDRKSTRLNSSHSQISYAVFCSKKKMSKNTLPNAALPISALASGT